MRGKDGALTLRGLIDVMGLSGDHRPRVVEPPQGGEAEHEVVVGARVVVRRGLLEGAAVSHSRFRGGLV